MQKTKTPQRRVGTAHHPTVGCHCLLAKQCLASPTTTDPRVPLTSPLVSVQTTPTHPRPDRFLRYALLLPLALTLLTTPAACQTQAQASANPTTQPTTQTAPAPTTQPTPTTLDHYLNQIEARATQTNTLRADIRYDRTQPLVGDHQRRFGRLTYDAGPPKRFAIHFDRLLVDTRLDREHRHYIFDGTWLVERYDADRLFIKRQIVPPNTHKNQPTPATSPDRKGGVLRPPLTQPINDTPPTPATHSDTPPSAPPSDATPGLPSSATNQPHSHPNPPDPLALGQGPFVLPLNLRKHDLQKRFNITLIPPTESDPENTIHLHLTPKPTFKTNHTTIDLWYHQETLLPLQARTTDDSQNISLVTLTNHQLNTPITPNDINTTEPTDRGWRIEITPYEPPQ